jgi:hypothetical protein
MDTPFKWMKQVALHFGGTSRGLAMSWPGHITDAGGIRRQFHAFTTPSSGERAGVRGLERRKTLGFHPLTLTL